MQTNTYDIIGTGYNTTRQADPFLTGRLLQLLGPGEDGHYLDLGCGTGNYTVALTNKGLSFYGVEPSGKMLQVARTRNEEIKWLPGTAEKIPLENMSVNGVIAFLTIHHWIDLHQSLKEIYRVLKKKGRAVFFTSTPEQMGGYWLNHYFPEMLNASIIQMPPVEIIKEAAMAAGFENVDTEKYFVRDDLQDHFLYAGKDRPGLYFDEKVRKGISSFCLLANEKEVSQGLAKLEADLENAVFGQIKAQYENNRGDYMFVMMDKK